MATAAKEAASRRTSLMLSWMVQLCEKTKSNRKEREEGKPKVSMCCQVFFFFGDAETKVMLKMAQCRATLTGPKSANKQSKLVTSNTNSPPNT